MAPPESLGFSEISNIINHIFIDKADENCLEIFRYILYKSLSHISNWNGSNSFEKQILHDYKKDQSYTHLESYGRSL